MMKFRHPLAAALLFTLALPVAAQDAGKTAVAWTPSVEAVKSAAGERLFRLKLNGRIAEGYIVYGSDFKADLGPNPTRVRFAADSGITPQGTLDSAGTHPGKDKAFNTAYTYFEGTAALSQVIAVAANVKNVTGTVRGQTCYEADGTCQLFSAKFEIPLPN